MNYSGANKIFGKVLFKQNLSVDVFYYYKQRELVNLESYTNLENSNNDDHLDKKKKNRGKKNSISL